MERELILWLARRAERGACPPLENSGRRRSHCARRRPRRRPGAGPPTGPSRLSLARRPGACAHTRSPRRCLRPRACARTSRVSAPGGSPICLPFHQAAAMWAILQAMQSSHLFHRHRARRSRTSTFGYTRSFGVDETPGVMKHVFKTAHVRPVVGHRIVLGGAIGEVSVWSFERYIGRDETR